MSKKSKLGIGLAIGVAAGAVAGILMSEKPGKKLRSDAKKEYSKYRQMLEEKDLESVARDIFGRTSKIGRKHLLAAKDQIASEVAQLHKRSKTVSATKYKTLVKSVVTKIKDQEEVTPEVLTKLTSYLEGDIKKIIKKSPVRKATSKSKPQASIKS